MSEERMKILQMLEKGLITPEEATRILESIGKVTDTKAAAPTPGATVFPTSTSAPTPAPSRNAIPMPSAPNPSASARDIPLPNSPSGYGHSYGGPNPGPGPGPAPGSGERAGGRPASSFNFEEFAGKLSKKFDSFAKDFEPKFTKFTEKAVEKTVAITDKISKSIEAGIAKEMNRSSTPHGGGVYPGGAGGYTAPGGGAGAAGATGGSGAAGAPGAAGGYGAAGAGGYYAGHGPGAPGGVYRGGAAGGAGAAGGVAGGYGGRPGAAATPRPAAAPRPTAAPRVGAAGKAEPANTRSFEMNVMEGENELVLETFNGGMNIQGYNGDKISLEISYLSKKQNPYLEFTRSGSNYGLRFDPYDFEKIDISAFVPEAMFKMINLSATNGSIQATGLRAEGFSVSSTNSNVKLNCLNTDKLMLEIMNASAVISDCVGVGGILSSTNGQIEVYGMDFSELSISGLNTPVSVNTKSLSRYADYIWVIDTNNANLSFALPDYRNLGCYLKAQSTLGDVRAGVPNLNFISNTGSFVEARSISYESFSKKLKLSLETSNGEINITI